MKAAKKKSAGTQSQKITHYFSLRLPSSLPGGKLVKLVATKRPPVHCDTDTVSIPSSEASGSSPFISARRTGAHISSRPESASTNSACCGPSPSYSVTAVHSQHPPAHEVSMEEHAPFEVIPSSLPSSPRRDIAPSLQKCGTVNGHIHLDPRVLSDRLNHEREPFSILRADPRPLKRGCEASHVDRMPSFSAVATTNGAQSICELAVETVIPSSQSEGHTLTPVDSTNLPLKADVDMFTANDKFGEWLKTPREGRAHDTAGGPPHPQLSTDELGGGGGLSVDSSRPIHECSGGQPPVKRRRLSLRGSSSPIAHIIASPSEDPLELSSSTKSPMPLNAEARAKEVIARIRAEAAVSSPPSSGDQDRISTNLHRNDSSDEEDVLKIPVLKPKTVQLGIMDSPLTDLDSSDEESGRASWRARSPPSSPSDLRKKTSLSRCISGDADLNGFHRLIRDVPTKKEIEVSEIKASTSTSHLCLPSDVMALEEGRTQLEYAEPQLSINLFLEQDAINSKLPAETETREIQHFDEYLNLPASLRTIFEIYCDRESLRAVLLNSCLEPRELRMLLDLALIPRDGVIVQECFYLLMQSQPLSTISFNSVLRAVAKLGVDPTVCRSFDWPVSNHVLLCAGSRGIVVGRLLAILTKFSHATQPENADWILLLLVLALDSSSSSDLTRDCVHTIHDMLHFIDQSGLLCVLIKLSSWLRAQPPSIQLRSIQLLNGGNRAATLVRWLSWSLLTGLDCRYRDISGLPPLEDILPLFDTNLRVRAPVSFVLTDKMDYINLRYYSEVLGTLLADCGGYIVRSGSTPHSDLEVIIAALSSLHPSIRDAHNQIERTIARAVVQRLALRLHFQYTASRKQAKARGNICRYLKSHVKGE